MSNSKQEILKAIRAQNRPDADLPEIAGNWITYPNRETQFASLLESVGGRCVFVESVSAIDPELEAMPAYTTAKQVVSLVEGVGRANVAWPSVTDPHKLETVDFAILPGQFGVAENGAVWISGERIQHRAIYFIAQHVALVIRADQIVDNMHQAYERLSFPKNSYGVFISGPSKTADIEQSLVIGAHGPRSLTVFALR